MRIVKVYVSRFTTRGPVIAHRKLRSSQLIPLNCLGIAQRREWTDQLHLHYMLIHFYLLISEVPIWSHAECCFKARKECLGLAFAKLLVFV